MMKKKSMAVAMAAVTVAMPASQVFAAVVDNTQTEEIKAMKAKALELMNKKFTTDGNLLINNNGADSIADTNVFKIELTTPGNSKAEVCTSYAEFERKFDKAYAKLEDGQSIKIGYDYAKLDAANKKIGYSTLKDGQIVDFKLETYTEKELEEAAANINAGEITDAKVKVGEIRATELSDDGTKKFEIRLSDDKNGLERYKEIKVGDVELSQRPVVRQENDYYVDVDGNALAEVKDGDVATLDGDYENSKIVNIKRLNSGDEKLKNAQIDGFYADTTSPAETPTIKMDVITKKGTEEITLNSSELYNKDEARVTAEGNDLVRKVNFYKELEIAKQDFYGSRYEVEIKETSTDKEMTIKIFKIDNESSTERSKIAEMKIVRDDKDNKAESYKTIRDIVKQEANAYNGITRVAAGADRYETAAEVSRLGFEKLEDEKAIVLVTGAQDKLVDGLTATPLAAALNGGNGAPVLLTGNDKIAKPVLDEIERLDAQKVYIVGGAISESVEKELKDVHGLKVDRISGDDRYETSMEVANEMVDNQKVNVKDVFVVGGKGEADALSAGAVAARKGKVAPILLTNKDKLSKDIKYFIDKQAVGSHAYVVGGTSSVSTSVYNEVLDVVGAKSRIDRLSGDNRQDTNAKVVETFFKDGDKATKVVVAKSDNKGMVDALGAGVYAGLNNAPVILATNNLTEDQEDYLNNNTNIDKDAASKVMVGNGISSTIAKFIKNLSTNK